MSDELNIIKSIEKRFECSDGAVRYIRIDRLKNGSTGFRIYTKWPDKDTVDQMLCLAPEALLLMAGAMDIALHYPDRWPKDDESEAPDVE